ncbi:hypothetical protein A1O3_00744 [Capronia epimyces CBS 606.96]|uniref:Ser/Thr-rich protein T10 in DGCR region n=1 Tax=Capronia epimyces CBS 606.96 TaxID=1182542 RepID=W9ZCE3_9EURO|nr:uncharacterized protein A1O3_00744 [Capronia epimyces CBS 606.96]EXJ92194.1 hypothetical protein A1O3_00744 [Capronia epimyces CBS 606.96]
MCIALISTAHPSYSLILIDNRDEYVNRPTDPAKWWPESHSQVFGGRDLQREVRGTWLGVTKTGKIAVLTNYREDTIPPPTATSRGAIIKHFLTEDVGSVEGFVEKVVETGISQDAGGFSLVCGNIGEKLAVISNRAKSQSQVPWIAGDTVQTVGLSNAAFSDRTWKKVLLGEELMLNTIRYSVENSETEDQLIQRFLALLSHDTLPREGKADEDGLEVYIKDLRDTIYVPPLGRKDMTGLIDDELRSARLNEKVEVVEEVDVVGSSTSAGRPTPTNNPQVKAPGLGVSGIYGTQKQTIVLADKAGNVRFFERTLFDENSNPIPLGKGDIDVTFKIEKS